MIQLIVEGKELTNISEEAKEWFLKSIMEGKEGPFTWKSVNGEIKAIILTVKLTEQLEMF